MEYKIREDVIDGCGPWTWIAQDTGAWDGPRGDWEGSHREKYLKHVRGHDVVLCAGGNQGMYPRLFANHFKTVYTFEPDKFNFHCLVNNCQSENIITFNCALSNSHRMIALNRAGAFENSGMHQVVEADSAIIPTLMIDDFDFKGLDLIQLDVEGHEAPILQGGLSSIMRFRPVIACENANEAIDEILFPLGYDRREHSMADTVYVCSV